MEKLQTEEYMRLFAIQNNECVAEFTSSKTVIHRPLLQKEMQKIGIAIPTYRQKSFEGKKIIKMDDPLFAKAFREIFFAHHMNTTLYRWEEDIPTTITPIKI